MKIGIVGCNHGLRVLLPAFRLDPRSEVVAIAGYDSAKTIERAKANNIPLAFSNWPELLTVAGLEAVAIAVPPYVQPQIVKAAFEQKLDVFAEKPLASSGASAEGLLRLSEGFITAVDFMFPEILEWQTVKKLLDDGGIGRLRHVNASWQVETYAVANRVHNWKTNSKVGGGILGNFASHALHYLEWFCGPITGLTAQISTLPDDHTIETGVTLCLSFQSGAVGSCTINCGAYMGTGHRLEFYGEDGSILLHNPTADYVRGFSVWHSKRGSDDWGWVEGLEWTGVDTSVDSRIAPTGRLVTRFLDAIESGRSMSPGFTEACRVQELLETAGYSNQTGLRRVPYPIVGREEHVEATAS